MFKAQIHRSVPTIKMPHLATPRAMLRIVFYTTLLTSPLNQRLVFIYLCASLMIGVL